MKAEFKFVVIILALAALASCGKITPAGGGSNEGGTEQGGGNTDPGTVPDTPLREISVAFDTKTTRTSLVGNKPEFNIGDYIRVAQADGKAKAQTYQVEMIHGGQLGFKTDLKGELVAVYPAERAIDDGYNITGVSVLSVQSGLFEDANICMADQSNEYPKPEDLNHLKFYNQTALIVVPVPQGTTQLVVTSLGKIGMSSYEPDYALRTTVADINTEGADEAARQQIIIDVDSTDLPKDYYVSVLPYSYENQLYLTDLNIDAVVDAAHGSMGGFSPSLIKGLAEYIRSAEFTVDKSAIYILPAKSLHEYVELDGLRWATMNVGASSTTDSGDYFSWAGIIGHQFVENAWTRFDNSLVEYPIFRFEEDCFDRNNSPHDIGSGYGKYNSEDQTVLDLWDDQAFIYWGGIWRIPTTTDFAMLCKRDAGNRGGLTFPAAGYGNGTVLTTYGSPSYYWTSNVDESNYNNAMIQSFSDKTLSMARYYGLPIRPVSGVSSVPDDPDDGGLTINPYTDGWGSSN